MRRSTFVIVIIALIALAPGTARAQGYFAPFIGFDFGGDAGNCPSFFTDCSVKRTAYGFSAGSLSHGIFGAEADFSYAPDFFGSSPSFGSNSVLTLMGNLVIALPAGGFHPYVTGGLGVIRTKVDSLAEIASFSNSNFGYNLGGGLMVMLPSHLGVRVDYRNIRSASDFSVAGLTLPGTKLSFSRISFALVLH